MTPLPRPVWPGSADGETAGPGSGQARPLEDALPDHQEAQAAKEVWFRHVQAERLEQTTEREARAAAQRRQPRRIVQLCDAAEGVFALCDDGTIWQLSDGFWLSLPAIPQCQLAED